MFPVIRRRIITHRIDNFLLQCCILKKLLFRERSRPAFLPLNNREQYSPLVGINENPVYCCCLLLREHISKSTPQIASQCGYKVPLGKLGPVGIVIIPRSPSSPLCIAIALFCGDSRCKLNSNAFLPWKIDVKLKRLAVFV